MDDEVPKSLLPRPRRSAQPFAGMTQAPPHRSASSRVVRRLLAFAATFAASLIACPLIVIFLGFLFPRTVRNFLFFWPQMALAPYGYTSPMDDMTRTHLGGGPNYAIAIAFWLVVGVGLSWLLRGQRLRVTALVAIPASFVVAIIVTEALQLADVGIYYEGP